MDIRKLCMLFCACTLIFVSFAGKKNKERRHSAPVTLSQNTMYHYFEMIEHWENEKKTIVSAGFAGYFQHLISARLQNKERKKI